MVATISEILKKLSDLLKLLEDNGDIIHDNSERVIEMVCRIDELVELFSMCLLAQGVNILVSGVLLFYVCKLYRVQRDK